MTESRDAFEFTLNGETVRIAGVSSQTTLLNYLRDTGRTGSKEGCAEGDCGACTVVIVESRPDGSPTYRAINSCITLLPMVAGREVWTAEGIAKQSPHPVQSKMAEHYGSQCGYCTPGFVMSMFEGYYRPDMNSPAKIADQLCGNLCRCTGYRPIRDAMQDCLQERSSAKPDVFADRLKRRDAPMEAVEYAHADEWFARPTTLSALLSLRAQWPDAHLVMGATEIGVELNKKFKAFPKLISLEGVTSMRGVKASDDGAWWIVGGSATLTELEEGLAGEIPAIDRMLSVFASRQVRNRASLAGNLVTASPIGDMAPVMLALDAEVEMASLRGHRWVPLSEFFTAYRRTVLAPDEVLVALHIPRKASAEGLVRKIESYKVSKRREMDISAVAAGLRVDLDAQNVIRYARVGLGGVAATPSRARATEQALIGKPLTREGIRDACEAIVKEFSPISDVRASADYRSALLVSLLEKFVDGATSEAIDLPPHFTPSPRYSTLGEGKGLRHESALGHATGKAVYVDDEARKRPMLTLWPVRSPHAHATIVSRDATRARAMPGVAAVLFAEDIPGENDVGALRKDESLLARDVVKFHGHMVAVVVADTLAHAREAADAVVVEYQPLDAILTIEAAVQAQSFHTEPHRIRRGDCDAALAASAHTVSGTSTIGGQEHFYLESHAAWAAWGDDDDVFVSSSTQHPSEIQAVVSHVLHIARNKVIVQSPRMGGGFGGKETQGNTWAALVALAAYHTRKPVRVMLDRDVDMQLTGKRHPFRAAYTAGFAADGTITALRARLESDGGWALDLSESIMDRALFHIDNAYFIPNVDVQGRVCKTNNVSHTAFRGFGGPQGMVVIEDVMDQIARTLSLSPEAVRARNLYRGEGATNTTHYGQHIDDNRIERLWTRLMQSSDFLARRAEIEAFNKGSARIKRGLAITPVKFGISFTASFLNQAGALVIVYRDGSVQVNHGGTEMGQGLYTKLLGITMRELGVSEQRVRMMKTQTDKVPNTSPTAASAGADLNGAAVRNACIILRERLLPVACELLAKASSQNVDAASVVFADDRVQANGASVSFEEVVSAAYFAQISLSTTGYYRTPGLGYDRVRGHGKPFHYFAFGAAVTEVEVDGYTGMKCVRRVDVLHDVGDSLNPNIDRGQIEGAFVQGAGWLTGEELVWNAKGVLLSHSASTYQIPAMSDAPADFRVSLLDDAAQSNTVHGSKAVGEPPLMLALSVREALRDAIAAFEPSRGPVRVPSPLTHETIHRAIRTRLDAH